MFSRLLERIQLVHIARYKKASADLAIWQERARKQSQELDHAKTQSDALRSKLEQLTKSLKEANKRAEDANARLEKLKKQGDRDANARLVQLKTQVDRKLKTQVDRMAERNRQREEVIQQLHQKLANAEHELVTARESLMVVEVKLDILEGAANVLDQRTRTAMAARSETTANV